MTPKAPSGTPRSWKSKLQAWLTRLTGAGLPPVSAPSPTPLAPQHPFLAQEPVSEANRPGAVAEATRTRQLMDRICAVNNSYVYRDYGTHTAHEVDRVPVEPLTAEELADAKKLLGVLVVGKPGAEPPKPKLRRFDVANYLRTEEEREEYLRQAAAYDMLEEARFDVERSRCMQHPAPFVPDFSTTACPAPTCELPTSGCSDSSPGSFSCSD